MGLLPLFGWFQVLFVWLVGRFIIDKKVDSVQETTGKKFSIRPWAWGALVAFVLLAVIFGEFASIAYLGH